MMCCAPFTTSSDNSCSVVRHFASRRPRRRTSTDPRSKRSSFAASSGTPLERADLRRARAGLDGGREGGHEKDLELALRYAAWALHTPAGRLRHADGVLFEQPARIDPQHLLKHAHAAQHDGVTSSIAATRDTCAAATASGLPTPGPTSPARWTRRTTASGATCRARIPAPRACRKSRHPAPPASRKAPSACRSPAARSKKRSPRSTS